MNSEASLPIWKTVKYLLSHLWEDTKRLKRFFWLSLGLLLLAGIIGFIVGIITVLLGFSFEKNNIFFEYFCLVLGLMLSTILSRRCLIELLSDYCKLHNATMRVLQYKKIKYLLYLSIFFLFAATELPHNFPLIPAILSISIWDTMIQPVAVIEGPTVQPSYNWSWKYIWRLFVIAWLECLVFAFILILLFGSVGGGLYLLYFLWPTHYMMIAMMTTFALFCLSLILFYIMSWGAFLARFSLFLYLNFPQKSEERGSDIELVGSTTI
ncbi:hypothetical protein phytr_390 [Candidatus Phycorickettsia trachydisci]|uniref:Uncharacterized protein n=1 Tax=Candidatus Phycorickettsia trachydisci TaxID=2115978 RepID=A0A2P1P6V1_9RICK|nr:hypothetical protein [Candidatus Phycorickettsia trachydisci]AVP87002.1 hypothetical protein phytr_390 [Candidatus Phycorickettsia trachydisci]